MERDTVRKLSYENMEEYTNNFCKDNLIGRFHMGKVYRGHIGGQEVVVKKWERSASYRFRKGDNMKRIRDEIRLLQDPEVCSHPNLVKLIGYCCPEREDDESEDDESEEHLCAVYEVDVWDTLFNLVPKDSFTWLERIKVIFDFARLLESFHCQKPPNLPCLLRNISADHILVDKDCNAKLYDFGMITGGIFPDRRCIPRNQYIFGCFSYINRDPRAPGYWSEKVDGFAFGTVLLMLISKRSLSEEDLLKKDIPHVNEWALNDYIPLKSRKRSGPSKFSLVHESLQQSAGFCVSDGVKLEKLAMRCVNESRSRPPMQEVVKTLSTLQAVQLIFGSKQVASSPSMPINKTFQLLV